MIAFNRNRPDHWHVGPVSHRVRLEGAQLATQEITARKKNANGQELEEGRILMLSRQDCFTCSADSKKQKGFTLFLSSKER
ncbi:hypothetical protein SKAU_G00263310 [Synaphobranchus kaupii]|uniref:Uncharacterized protein n=1 Tax=Synaphobranchus kaupii TaxID=118154 RepID=A0A9Q1EYU2_SYNKA|nr:hypothetical protein SKAU_G00263310 [Synaphobranchus kaupii]